MTRLSIGSSLGILLLFGSQVPILLSDNAQAQLGEPLGTITTDMNVYPHQSEMTISGRVNASLSPDEHVLLRIVGQSRDVYTQEVDIEEDGTFSHIIRVDDAPSREGGYTVLAEIYNEDGTSIKFVLETLFFIISEETFLNCYSEFVCKYNFVYQNNTFPIIYLGHERILNASLSETEKSLTIQIAGNAEGIRLAIPKDLLQSTSIDGNTEQEFNVSGDGQVVDYVEHNETERGIGQWINEPKEFRVLSISYQGTQTIKIIGTKVLPEFSSSLLVIMVVVASIVGTVVWSRWGTGNRKFRQV